MNFLENTKELLLAYPSMKQVTLSESVNVMLPPQFYTLKKEALPLRYAYQAKKIAPSLFEGRGIKSIKETLHLHNTRIYQIDQDLFLEGYL